MRRGSARDRRARKLTTGTVSTAAISGAVFARGIALLHALMWLKVFVSTYSAACDSLRASIYFATAIYVFDHGKRAPDTRRALALGAFAS